MGIDGDDLVYEIQDDEMTDEEFEQMEKIAEEMLDMAKGDIIAEFTGDMKIELEMLRANKK